MVGGGSVGAGKGSGVDVGTGVGMLVGVGSVIISAVAGGAPANEGLQAGKLNKHTAAEKRSLIDFIILNSMRGMSLL
jgi:hypothetical protein